MIETKCPACGLGVLLNAETHETQHVEPVCDGWRKLMTGAGAGGPIGHGWKGSRSCGQQNCTALATQRFTWVGSGEHFACDPCAARARGVAAAMGFHLEVFALSPLELNDADRQAVLMALAHLSVERPGWEDYLHRIALRLDSERDGRGVMYDEFRKLHRLAVVAGRKQWTQPCLACGGPRAEHDSSPRCEGFRQS